MEKKPVIAILANFPLHVANSAFPQVGWHMATWLSAAYEMLKEQDKYEIHWLVFSKQVRWRKVFESSGQFFHVMPEFSLNYAQKTHYLHSRWLVKRELNRLKPDLLHAWGTEHRNAICGMGFRGKKILSVQGNLTACVKRTCMKPFVERQAIFERKAMPSYDLLTGESPWSLDRIRDIVPDKPLVKLEYCVESRFYKSERNPEASPVCLLAGDGSEIKNVKTALAAFSSPELRHIKLLMAGVPKNMYADLPPNIEALGGKNRDEMVELISRAWCLVHPSLAETGPTVAKEARVMGMPVIISSETGSKQYVEHGKSGFVFAPTDVEALKQHVLAVCADRETAIAMGEYGREDCRRALSRETMMAGLVAIYDQLLAE